MISAALGFADERALPRTGPNGQGAGFGEPPPYPPPVTLAQVIEQWRSEGPLVRVPTGIAALDRMCRGGLPVPWRLVVVGAPSAGKTALTMIVANHLARAAGAAGLVVGLLAIDEEADDLTVRLAQMAGYTIAEAEAREPDVLAGMAADLADLRVLLYDPIWTIDGVAEDIARRAKAEGRLGAMVIDSAQVACSVASTRADTPRMIVEANLAAVRAASSTHRLLTVTTSEANRASYRSEEAAETGNDLAAGAESRALEFGAQTLLMLRTPKDHPDVVHVRVVKNRRGDRGEFWLRLDRERHAVVECGDPAADPTAAAEAVERERQAARTRVDHDAGELAKVLGRRPAGVCESDLRGAVQAAGLRWGRDRLAAAKACLLAGRGGVRLVDRTPEGRGRTWQVARSEGSAP